MKTHLLKLTPAEFCRETGACADGVKFAIKCRTMAKTWEKCPRVDWLVWILKMSDIGASIMGGMTKEEARAVILKLTGRKAGANPLAAWYASGAKEATP